MSLVSVLAATVGRVTPANKRSGLNKGLGKYLRSDKGKDALDQGDLPMEGEPMIGKKGRKQRLKGHEGHDHEYDPLVN